MVCHKKQKPCSDLPVFVSQITASYTTIKPSKQTSDESKREQANTLAWKQHTHTHTHSAKVKRQLLGTTERLKKANQTISLCACVCVCKEYFSHRRVPYRAREEGCFVRTQDEKKWMQHKCVSVLCRLFFSLLLFADSLHALHHHRDKEKQRKSFPFFSSLILFLCLFFFHFSQESKSEREAAAAT